MTKFSLIYGDPAWLYETYSENGKDRSPEQHYDCMPLAEIMRLPVADMAADDSVCLLWVIDPMLDKGLEVLAAWGFEFKTVGFYYVKVGRALTPHLGMGYWTRANPEICLLGTRGKPKRMSKGVRRLILDLALEMSPDEKTILAPVTEHSEKPLEAYDRIERLVAGPYLELFARHARSGWHQWGNEVGKTGGVPSLINLPGYPARAFAATGTNLFGGINAA